MAYKKPMLLGDLMKTSLSKAVPEIAGKLDDMRVVDEWRNMLGPVMGRYSTNEKFENGQLSANIRSALLKSDLFMQRDIIIRKLNERLGETKVLSLMLY